MGLLLSSAIIAVVPLQFLFIAIRLASMSIQRSQHDFQSAYMLRQLSMSSRQQQHGTLCSIAEEHDKCSLQPMLSKRILSKTKTFTCLTALRDDERPAVAVHRDGGRHDEDDWGFFDHHEDPNESSQTSSDSQLKHTQ